MARFESLIAANKFKSAVLVGGFIVFYTGVIFVVVLGVLALAWKYADWKEAFAAHSLLVGLLVAHALAVFLVICASAGGASLVLSVSRARRISRQDDPELHNVVEEMALASGLPMPAIYLLESPALNALATAYGERHAAVAVTRGLRQALDRDQLQAVVAHEMARIRNYDIALMTFLAGLMGMLSMASQAVKELVISGVRTARGSAETASLVFAVIILFVPLVLPAFFFAPFFVRLIQLAVSRERLFLADAEAARLTRYPEALAQALERVAGDAQAVHPAARATAHLFFVQPVLEPGRRPSGWSVWHSHPPIAERVARLRSIGNVEE